VFCESWPIRTPLAIRQQIIQPSCRYLVHRFLLLPPLVQPLSQHHAMTAGSV
jgi:hypothetical protein